MTTELAFNIPKSWWLSANDRTHWAVKARATRDRSTTNNGSTGAA